ncbi:hypothetical protein KSP35_13530 [Aquihabitans sp. G128]|uniref:hypothetical protein n=1 Tax=Aquihabitans sp. G128 TaxID=2849779 RepID=UPI001C22ACB4|nr:hypothetical protein [Aquihabitans sp. G128]QXC59420.1 hypothetical protein KSP35_13530 [Aquihabitans sp. G128]
MNATVDQQEPGDVMVGGALDVASWPVGRSVTLDVLMAACLYALLALIQRMWAIDPGGASSAAGIVRPSLALTMRPADAATLLAAFGAFIIAGHLRLISLGQTQAGSAASEAEKPAAFLGTVLALSSIPSLLVGMAAFFHGPILELDLAGCFVLGCSMGPAVLAADATNERAVSAAMSEVARIDRLQRHRRLEAATETWNEPRRLRTRPWLGVEIVASVLLTTTACWVHGGAAAFESTSGLTGVAVASTVVAFSCCWLLGISLATRNWLNLVVAAAGLVGFGVMLGTFIAETAIHDRCDRVSTAAGLAPPGIAVPPLRC